MSKSIKDMMKKKAVKEVGEVVIGELSDETNAVSREDINAEIARLKEAGEIPSEQPMPVIDYESVKARMAEITTTLQGPDMLDGDLAESLREEWKQLADIVCEPIDEELAKSEGTYTMVGIDVDITAAAVASTESHLSDVEKAMLGTSEGAAECPLGKLIRDTAPKVSGLGTNSIPTGEGKADSCVVSKVIDYNPISASEPAEIDYDKEVVVTIGNILDLHRKLSYCLRGNQRPAILSCQQLLLRLLPEGTPIIHREPVE